MATSASALLPLKRSCMWWVLSALKAPFNPNDLIGMSTQRRRPGALAGSSRQDYMRFCEEQEFSTNYEKLITEGGQFRTCPSSCGTREQSIGMRMTGEVSRNGSAQAAEYTEEGQHKNKEGI